jgi:hypothetical protein
MRKRVIGEPPNLIHNVALKGAEIGRLSDVNADLPLTIPAARGLPERTANGDLS